MVDAVPVKPVWQERLDVQRLWRQELCGRFEGGEAELVKTQEPVAERGVPEYSLLQVNMHAECHIKKKKR
jgi:hypothetical protein